MATLDAWRIGTRDPNLRKAVEYLNQLLALRMPITWERIIDLYELLRGDRGHPQYTPAVRRQRLHTATQLLPQKGRPNVIAAINARYARRADVLHAARRLYEMIGPGAIFAEEGYGLPGFDRISPSHSRYAPTQDGHHRLAWLLMNALLLRNGYRPFYFEVTDPYEQLRHGGEPLARLLHQRVRPVNRLDATSGIFRTATQALRRWWRSDRTPRPAPDTVASKTDGWATILIWFALTFAIAALAILDLVRDLRDIAHARVAAMRRVVVQALWQRDETTQREDATRNAINIMRGLVKRHPSVEMSEEFARLIAVRGTVLARDDQISRRQSVLHLGSGASWLPVVDAALGIDRVVVSDINPSTIQWLDQFVIERPDLGRRLNAVHQRVDATQLPRRFRSGAFDQVVAGNLFSYSGFLGDRREALRQILGALRPNGRLWITNDSIPGHGDVQAVLPQVARELGRELVRLGAWDELPGAHNVEILAYELRAPPSWISRLTDRLGHRVASTTQGLRSLIDTGHFFLLPLGSLRSSFRSFLAGLPTMLAFFTSALHGFAQVAARVAPMVMGLALAFAAQYILRPTPLPTRSPQRRTPGGQEPEGEEPSPFTRPGAGSSRRRLPGRMSILPLLWIPFMPWWPTSHQIDRGVITTMSSRAAVVREIRGVRRIQAEPGRPRDPPTQQP